MGQRCLELPFRYTSLSGDRRRAPLGASFTFLSNHHLPVDLLDSCNGLLLCRSYYVSHAVAPFRYIVCNPATDKWAVLPNSDKDSRKVATTSLGFDPAASPHFHVFELVLLRGCDGQFDDFGLAHAFIQRSQGSLHFANFQRDQDGVAIRLVASSQGLSRRTMEIEAYH
ncbi:hypothetical protein D1007_05367 [Hordeum vulgare]|nr:hypothetical protein D1007_05367 [Hordeum vulgare]